MKSIYIYRKIVLLSVMILTTLMTSCTDFLTIIPPDKIVHEQFWHTKEDVNGMLATSYLKLASTDAVSRAIVWGELRADNLTFEASKTKDDIRYIVEANITDENSYTKWGIFYEAINYANLVIEYAPLVIPRDPDFTQSECDIVVGEMYAMRALCHFYLLRTFRNIPMAMVPAINDSELPDYKPVHPLDALDMIMNDLNRAQNRVRGNYSNSASNHGRITRNAVLAMKADVNLWRAAFTAYYKANGDANPLANVNVQHYYTECIANCDEVLNNLDAQYKEDNKHKPVNPEDENDKYHLIYNVDEFITDNETLHSKSFDQIFIDENSRESIFELQIDQNLCSQSSGNADGNTFKGLQFMYGAGVSDVTPQVEVPKSFMKKYEKDDLRKYSFVNYPVSGLESDIPNKLKVAKYIANVSPAIGFRAKDKVDANWIVYRQTDVMLMKAEALVLKEQPNIKESFDIVNTINVRSRKDTTLVEIINPLSEPKTVDEAHALVLDERLRELSFEGKRWYDLVRKALRENTTENITFVADKLTSGATSVKNKMVSIDNMFFPINVEELRFNEHLVQNPAYNTDDSTIGMSK